MYFIVYMGVSKIVSYIQYRMYYSDILDNYNYYLTWSRVISIILTLIIAEMFNRSIKGYYKRVSTDSDWGLRGDVFMHPVKKSKVKVKMALSFVAGFIAGFFTGRKMYK